MLNENAVKWVAALRSGEFEQTTGQLHSVEASEVYNRPAGYCCLGVACAIFPNEIKRDVIDGSERFEDTLNVLPEKVREWLGLEDDGGTYYGPDGVRRALWIDNDNGTPFAAIADIIESEPRGLFKA